MKETSNRQVISHWKRFKFRALENQSLLNQCPPYSTSWHLDFISIWQNLKSSVAALQNFYIIKGVVYSNYVRRIHSITFTGIPKLLPAKWRAFSKNLILLPAWPRFAWVDNVQKDLSIGLLIGVVLHYRVKSCTSGHALDNSLIRFKYSIIESVSSKILVGLATKCCALLCMRWNLVQEDFENSIFNAKRPIKKGVCILSSNQENSIPQFIGFLSASFVAPPFNLPKITTFWKYSKNVNHDV